MRTETMIDAAALSKLKEMIGGDSEDLAELVDDFVTAFPQQMAQMRSQSDANDWAALRITSHSCKSNARDMGASDLSQLCAALELQCKDGQPTNPADQLDRIDEAGNAAITSLRQLDLANV